MWLKDRTSSSCDLSNRTPHMRGSRKFCQTVSNFFIRLMRGGRIQIPLLAGHQRPMVAQHWLLDWQLCDFKGIRTSIFQGGGESGPPAPLWIRKCPTCPTTLGPIASRGRHVLQKTLMRKKKHRCQDPPPPPPTKFPGSKHTQSEHHYKSVENWKCSLWRTTEFYFRSSVNFDFI